MISAKLIKDLEKRGFELEFPAYGSNEELMIDILREHNERLLLSIPIILKEGFDYAKIAKALATGEKTAFDRILLISDRLFKDANIDSRHIEKTIKANKLAADISKEELARYSDAFRQATQRRSTEDEEALKEQIDMRSALNTNKALAILFSPGKIRILDKIFNHENLTNTELKYYYRSIKPILRATLNENIQKYARIIESTKKQTAR